MAGAAGFTTDDVSDVTVLRELEKIKKFIVGKTIKDFSITEETESTIKVSITTNDKTWDVTLPRGGVIPENLVYTDVNQEINSEKKFKQRIEFDMAEGTTLESDNVAVKTEIETPEGLLVSQGVVAEAKESGVKVSKYNDGLECEISFGDGIVVSDPYTESDDVTTKNGMIKVLRDDVDEIRDEVGDLDLDKEDKPNKVSVWSAIPNDTHYPSEKLVYDSLYTTHKNNLTPITPSGFEFNRFVEFGNELTNTIEIVFNKVTSLSTDVKVGHTNYKPLADTNTAVRSAFNGEIGAYVDANGDIWLWSTHGQSITALLGGLHVTYSIKRD